MDRLFDSLASECGLVFVMDMERCESLPPRRSTGTKGELPAMFIVVGESVSGW